MIELGAVDTLLLSPSVTVVGPMTNHLASFAEGFVAFMFIVCIIYSHIFHLLSNFISYMFKE